VSNLENADIEDRPANYASGWMSLLVWLVLAAVTLWYGYLTLAATRPPFQLAAGIALAALAAKGFVIIPPNMAAVLTFFGKYTGTIRDNGFFWCNPLSLRRVCRYESTTSPPKSSRSMTRMAIPSKLAQ